MTLNNENVVPFDCDDTLICWPKDYTKKRKGRKAFKCPYSNKIYYLVPHKKHIELVQKFKGRGYHIIVWSAAGYKWAEIIVKGLKLQPFVDLVMTKPCKYVDDLSCENWMGPRIYLK